MRRFIACVLLPCYLAACTSWQTQEVSPEQVLAEKQPDKVWVKLTNGYEMVLIQPVVAGDSLRGVTEPSASGGGGGTWQVSIALADVAYLSISEYDSEKTVRAVSGIMAGLGILALANMKVWAEKR